MIRNIVLSWILSAVMLWSASALGQDKIELDVTTIRGNKEQPQALFIVPWKEEKRLRSKQEHKIVLHSLFGDLFDPVVPQQHGFPSGRDNSP